MRKLIAPLLFALLTLGTVTAAESAADLEAKGVAALKKSQTESDQIVQAALNFGKASALYDKAGKADKLTEMNSFLFWCKKKMSAEQFELLQKNKDAAAPAIAKRMEDLEAEVPPAEEAKAFFDRADAYAKAHPAEHLLIAVRFFEVAELFAATDIRPAGAGAAVQRNADRDGRESRYGQFGGQAAPESRRALAR